MLKPNWIGPSVKRYLFENRFGILGKVADKFILDMATHAAMVESMDTNIGRLLNTIDSMGELDNTVILYLSDNGAAGYHHSLPNAPFEGQKATLWEGGTRTHLIMWGAQLHERAGDVVFAPIHVMDILPTLLDMLGRSYPRTYKGRAIDPLAGRSFFDGLMRDEWVDQRRFFWDLVGYQAVVDGKWKYLNTDRGEIYLFDLESDATETQDLSEKHPDKITELQALYDDWARENHVLPWSVVRAAQPEFAGQPMPYDQ